MRRRYSREQWRLWLGEQAASGLSISAFCLEHDVPENSFYYWRKKFAVEQRSGQPRLNACLCRSLSLLRATSKCDFNMAFR